MSSEDLLAKFDEMVKRFKQEFNEIIEGERAKMRAEVEAYKEEKLRMKAIEVSDDDMINLNVGGKKMTTKRSTLCQVEGSLLASMFSGRWEDSLARDEDGRIFFDFNPQYFVYVLDYLRARTIATAENPAPLPKVAEDQVKHFGNLVEYLGLGDEIVPPEIVPPEKFNLHSTGVTLEEGGKVAVHDSTQSHKYILGENTYQQGIVRRKLNIESFRNNYWMQVGVTKGDVVPQNDTSYKWPGSYGWTLGSSGGQGVWKEGSYTRDTTLVNLTKQGDTVELVLDCDAAKLSLYLPTGQQFHVDLPKSQTWRLNVCLLGANDRIRIVEA
jgi:hypothetical protein